MRSYGRSTWCTEEQEYMVMKTSSAKSARTMASQVGGPCGGRAQTTRRRQGSAGGRTRVNIGGLTGLASKPGETCLTGLDLKTGGGLGAVKVRAEGTWRHRKACVEAKRSREGGVSVRGSSKRMDKFAPAWAVIVNNNVGVFLSSRGDLEDKKRGMDIHPIWSTSFSRPILLPLSSSLFSHPLLHIGLGIEMDL